MTSSLATRHITVQVHLPDWTGKAGSAAASASASSDFLCKRRCPCDGLALAARGGGGPSHECVFHGPLEGLARPIARGVAAMRHSQSQHTAFRASKTYHVSHRRCSGVSAGELIWLGELICSGERTSRITVFACLPSEMKATQRRCARRCVCGCVRVGWGYCTAKPSWRNPTVTNTVMNTVLGMDIPRRRFQPPSRKF